MTRVKRGTIANKKRAKVLKKTKGFRWGRKSKERAAKEALLHAQSRMFKGRKENKRNYRALWQTQISAAVKAQGISYSKFIAGLKKNKIELDRKVLAEIANKYPKVFT
ncbi:MAG TPA: 50S ribosomal protein L20, partial [Candidatus Paceibacterota bacterium]|nr:50S ribosomal protein L20 [Candidatus Paceibacterota bacterium]